MFESDQIADKGDKRIMSLESLLKGLVIGGVVGLAMGVLCAPKRGSETREDIALSIKRLSGKAKEGYEQVLHNAEELVDRGKAEYTGNVQRVKNAIHAGTEAFNKPA
jgi:gas vesicle protein